MNPSQPDHPPEIGFLRWRTSRLIWIGLVSPVVLIAVIFFAGNRGGEDAWQRCRRELEAKGEILDWEAFIPPPIPDEQNYFKAPGMNAWFSRQIWQSNKVAIFELPGWVQNRPLTLDHLRAMPEGEDTNDPATTSSGSREKLRAWFAQHESEYRLLAEASERPLARLDTDYRVPFALDIPNFVNLRNVAQALASHANLSVLDGEGDAAVQDLFMMRRLADVSGNSPTLVGAMIRVAILGLYVQNARDALESGALSAAQLKAIEEQLSDVNLLRDYTQSIRAERAAEVRWLNLPPAELARRFQQAGVFSSASARPIWQFDFQAWLGDLRLKLNLRSRGWLAANLAFVCRVHQDALDQVDLDPPRIHATAHSLVVSNLQQTLARAPADGRLAAIMMPNHARALVAVARAQTLLDQLRVACALERYRLAHGTYPDTLESLLPEFLDRVPGDLFADRPLRYRRFNQIGYQIWSVGWDEKDDRGNGVLDADGQPVYSEQPGDWVWQKLQFP